MDGTRKVVFFDGSNTIECESCEGVGRKALSEYEDAKCTSAGCCGGYVECFNCGDGTPADVVFDGDDTSRFCLTCIKGGLGSEARYGLRFTDAGRFWAVGGKGESLTQELPAISFDDETEPGVIYERVPAKREYEKPNAPSDDARATQVELRAIGGE